MESDRSQTTGFSHYDSAVKLGEIPSPASTLEASKQFSQTELSDRTFSGSGHREKHFGSERNAKETSESERSTGENLSQIEIGFSEPKLNPAPSLETEKDASKNKDREKSYGNIYVSLNSK